MESKWVPIPGLFDYEASNAGRIRRISTGRLLTPAPDRRGRGYPKVSIQVEGKWWARDAHRLIALAFLGPCPDGCVVNHIDSDRNNSVPLNLEYITPSENTKHAIRHRGVWGVMRPRERCRKGHVYDEANTIVWPSGRRTCRACRQSRDRTKWQRENRDKAHLIQKRYRDKKRAAS